MLTLVLLFLFLWLFPSCRVAGITDDLSSPHRPVRLLARSQSSTFQISLTRVFPSCFGRPLFLFPGISALNTLLSMCSPSLLITCPYQFNLLSVIFLEACATRSETSKNNGSVLLFRAWILPGIDQSLIFMLDSVTFE